MRILLVEDEPELSCTLAAHLCAAGYVVDCFGSLACAVQAVLGAEYQAILLDRRLPDGDGLALIPIVRTRHPSPPVIVLSALHDIPDRIEGLDAGAEDYLVKPFATAELLARLRVLLRRAGSSEPIPKVRFGSIDFDLARQEVTVHGKSLPLPRRELAILSTLVRRAGRVVMREHLHEQVYGFDDEVGTNALEAQVSRLRKRLSDCQAGVMIDGIRGVGYMLRVLS